MILIGLGANLPTVEGSPRQTLEAALRLMPAFGISPVRCSSFFSTPALAHTVQPPYVNAVAVVASAMPARDLLAALHRIEIQFGRVRHTRWAARTLDLDLLDYQGQIVTAQGPRGADAGAGPLPLALPHPGIEARGFVLVPLAEVAPNWVHPRLGVTAVALLERLKAAEGPSAVAGIRRI
ncbi:MAG: 2-amino-4-hydroxy-6-hydroxymethyldihydropteridine diphosphokinase [Parvibaculum sp.]|nr:2-amino-4-hydroxy-6-hydroxymethyldihydropteridine diphosphokinase [Parvibaculum sp.]